ncbi:hypothetical protein DFP72DRAFT_1064654 [Ephemerocybe angulata]|uniref:Uncharacterized protein n=1 Tax=Ephemerocybe angulata TaxID=980116 RepID=A0A8H6I4L4_9AGAR|nr:hypothetical protein DFP72DRAFT_1064654 [Tulosesus angulatus]
MIVAIMWIDVIAGLVLRILITTTIIAASAYPRSRSLKRTYNVSAEQTAEGLDFKLQDGSDLNADRANATMRRSGLGYEEKGLNGPGE